MNNDLPYAPPGQRIGLLGGSFDPPHLGHLHISKVALKRFGLHQVWWLVSPGNPLKPNPPAPMHQRLQACRDIAAHPRIRVTDFEARIGTRYTAETLRALLKRRLGVKFVWLMGADNLTQFDHWQDWRWIMDHVAVGIIARPNDRMRARTSKAAKIYRQHKLPGSESTHLPTAPLPAWSFVNAPMLDISSTTIRARSGWAGEAVAQSCNK
ncbi:MAG: nicotinic acid mononucleotide adenylyltransferase [Rhodobacterales bacterium]|nr:MAG: nicotinic acid mononucleotide adenylyltransferase [Rhodobacterales bacterium]